MGVYYIANKPPTSDLFISSTAFLLQRRVCVLWALCSGCRVSYLKDGGVPCCYSRAPPPPPPPPLLFQSSPPAIPELSPCYSRALPLLFQSPLPALPELSPCYSRAPPPPPPPALLSAIPEQVTPMPGALRTPQTIPDCMAA